MTTSKRKHKRKHKRKRKPQRQEWTEYQEYRLEIVSYLMQSLPALIVAFTAFTSVWLAWQKPRWESIQTYKAAASQAIEQDDWDSAEVYLRKLAYLDESDPETQFNLALLAEQQDDVDRAKHLVAKIAPDDHAGFGPAHLWRVQSLLAMKPPQDWEQNWQRLSLIEQQLAFSSQKQPGASQATQDQSVSGPAHFSLAKELYDGTSEEHPADERLLKRIQQHLGVSLQTQPDNLQARTMLGRVCYALGEFSEAAQHFATAAKKDPSLRVPLAKLLVVFGKRQAASNQGAAAIREYSKLVKANEKDADAWLKLGEAQAFMTQYEAAAATYQDGLNATADARFHSALANLYTAWFDKSGKAQSARQLELIQTALSHAPTDPDVLKRLGDLARQQGKQADKARETLEQSLKRGDAKAMNHLILGNLALEQGDYEKSVLHLEQAYQADPDMKGVANNLAWALAFTESPQLERALDLINSALRRRPIEPAFRDTRGQVLVRMQRWEEAVTDLEFAIKFLPDNALIHKSLAAAYDKLGQPELADRHRQLFTKLQPKPDAEPEKDDAEPEKVVEPESAERNDETNEKNN